MSLTPLLSILLVQSTLSLAHAQSGSLSIFLDGRPLGMHSYKLEKSNILMSIKLTSNLYWQPVFDPDHQTIDLASCIRIGENSLDILSIYGRNVNGITVSSTIDTLPLPIERNGGRFDVPLIYLTNLLGYKAKVDWSKKTLNFTSPIITANSTDLQRNCSLRIRFNKTIPL
jgi:hypothetical protein